MYRNNKSRIKSLFYPAQHHYVCKYIESFCICKRFSLFFLLFLAINPIQRDLHCRKYYNLYQCKYQPFYSHCSHGQDRSRCQLLVLRLCFLAKLAQLWRAQLVVTLKSISKFKQMSFSPLLIARMKLFKLQ